MGPFPLQLAQRYVAPHRVHYRSLSLTIAHYRREAQRSAAVVEMPFNSRYAAVPQLLSISLCAREPTRR